MLVSMDCHGVDGMINVRQHRVDEKTNCLNDERQIAQNSWSNIY